MTSPQQPQPEPGPHGAGAQPQPMPAAPPMPPASPALDSAPAGGPPSEQPPAAPAAPKEAGTMMLQAQAAPQQPQQPQAPQQPTAGPNAAPAKEAGTMMLQTQPLPQAQPQPQPLAAHDPGKDAGTMMLQTQAAPPQQPQQPQAQQPQAPQHQAAPPAHAPQQPPQAPNWQAGQGGYVSPIPVNSTHLGHALASEWTKIRSVRSTIWTLGVMVVLVLGIDVLVAMGVSGHTLGPVSPLFFGFFGMLLGVLCVLPLGVLVTSSEYGTGMIRTTLTACPSRGRVLAAKAIVFFALTFLVTTVLTGLVAIIDNGMLSDTSTADVTGAEWFKSTVGVGLYVAFLGLLALAVGSLIRHSAGAITIMIGFVLLPFVLAMFMLADSLKDVRNFLLGYSIPNQITVMYGGKFPFVQGGPADWEPLWIVMGVAAVALGGAYVAKLQRDV